MKAGSMPRPFSVTTVARRRRPATASVGSAARRCACSPARQLLILGAPGEEARVGRPEPHAFLWPTLCCAPQIGDIYRDSPAPFPFPGRGPVATLGVGSGRGRKDECASLLLIWPGVLQHGAGHPAGRRPRLGCTPAARPAPSGGLRPPPRLQRMAGDVRHHGPSPSPGPRLDGVAGVPSGGVSLLVPVAGGLRRLP